MLNSLPDDSRRRRPVPLFCSPPRWIGPAIVSSAGLDMSKSVSEGSMTPVVIVDEPAVAYILGEPLSERRIVPDPSIE